MSIEQLRLAFWDMVHGDSPDNLLLRFLRARKWDVGKALAMMARTFHWRVFDGKVAETELWGEAGALRDGDDEFLLQFRSKSALSTETTRRDDLWSTLDLSTITPSCRPKKPLRSSLSMYVRLLV